MADVEQVAQALMDAGLAPVLVDAAPDPFHIAVPFPGSSVEDDPVLRINRLDSADGDIDLWQMIVVIPARAASPETFEMAQAFLNTVNASLMIGKVIAATDEMMLYFSANHFTDTGDSVLRTAPPVVRFVLENLAVLSPALCDLLTTAMPEAAPDFEAAEAVLLDAERALMELMEQLTASGVNSSPNRDKT